METNQIDCPIATDTLPGEAAREKARCALNAARYVVKRAVEDMEQAAKLHGAVTGMEVVTVMQALDKLDAVKLR